MNRINLNLNNNPKFKSATAAYPVEQIPYNEQYAQTTETQYNVPVEQDIQIPDLYYTPSNYKEPLTIKEKIKKADMMGMIYPYVEAPILGGLTAFGIIKGIDAYSNACGGEYEKSILGKATAAGNRIATSKFWEKRIPKAISNGTKKVFDGAKKLYNKSALLKSMFETPARPEWSMPKSEMIPQAARNVEDFTKIMDTVMGIGGKKREVVADFIKRKELGLTKQEIEAAKNFFRTDKIKKINPIELSNWTLLKRLGNISDSEILNIIKKSDATDITRGKILELLELTADDLVKIHANPEQYVDKVKEAARKAGNKVRIGSGRINILGQFQPLERTISMDQVANKIHSITGGAQTKLGRFFAKAMQKVHRGFTFGGGYGGMLLFIVPGIVMALKNTKKAEKDEKVGTVANGLIESISWVFTFPLAIASTYALGGLQNAGMGKDKVEMLRKEIEKFNSKTFTDKQAYKTARKSLDKRIKALRRVKDQNLLTKALRKISKFFYQDLGMIKPYQGGNAIANFARRLPNKFRNIVFVPIRFILAGFGIEGLYRKLIEKGTRSVFGKHYDYEKELEQESRKEEQKKFLKEDLQARLLEAQREKILGPQINQVQNSEQQSLASAVVAPVVTSTLEKGPKQTATAPEQTIITPVQTEEVIENKYIPSQKTTVKVPQNTIRDNYTYIPSSENVIKPEKVENTTTNKYIPSQIGAQFVKTFDNSGLDAALKRAERAEQKALQTLAGKFGNV